MGRLDKSKYNFIDEKKLDDLYLTQFLREIWSVPADKLNEYFAKFYPKPTALEAIEIRQMIALVRKISKNIGEGPDSVPVPLSEEEQKLLQYKHSRMFGKERQIIELSGREGGPITIKDMSDEELDLHLRSKLGSIAKAIKKSKKANE